MKRLSTRQKTHKSRDREKFLDSLETAIESDNAVVHAFCLMDNHYHFMLIAPSANLPEIMRHINTQVLFYKLERRPTACSCPTPGLDRQWYGHFTAQKLPGLIGMEIAVYAGCK